MFLLLNMLSRLVIALLSRSKHLLISWMQSPSAEAQEDKGCYCLHCFPIYKPWSDGTGCHDLHFVKAEPAFSLSSFTFTERLFSSSSFSAIRMVSSTYLRQVGLIKTSASLQSEDVGTLFFVVVWVLVAEAVLPSLRPGFLMTALTFCNGNSFGEGSCHCNDVDLGAFLTPDISTQ